MQLYQGDCLEMIKMVPDKSVDLVLTDPPYNVGKADWDKIAGYVDWCSEWLRECVRVLKDNGSLYFWHNDMAQIAMLMERIRQDGQLSFISFCIWDKGESYRCKNWKKRDADGDNAPRSWFNRCEYCLEFAKSDDTGRLNNLLKNGGLLETQEYLREEKRKTGMTIKQIGEIIGQRSTHYFARGGGFRVPQRAEYEKLKTTGRFEKSYDDLIKEIEEAKEKGEEKRYYHRCDEGHCNVWRRDVLNAAQKESKHPCEKPVDILRRIIRVSCRPGGTVLDLFMGGGSTGIAAMQEGREFIGIERDDRWFAVAAKRLEEERTKPEQLNMLDMIEAG